MEPQPLASRLPRVVIVGLGLGIALALASVSLTDDPDLYWHLALAREAMRTHSWLPVDVFSYSVAGAAWPYKDLAAETVLYAGVPAMGFAWLAALKALSGAAMIASVHVAPRPPERSRAVTLVAGGLLLSSFWLVERPNLFSMTLFAIVLTAIERARRQAMARDLRGMTRTLVAAIAVDWLWTWLHRFALLGHALLALLAIDLTLASLAAVRGRPRAAPPARAAVLPALAAVASLALGLLNPNGLQTYTSGFTMAAHADLRAAFLEWKSPSLEEMWGAFPVTLLLSTTVIATVVVRCARSDRGGPEGPVRAAHAALLIALAALTCDSIRWAPYLAIASAFVAARLLGEQSRVRSAPAWSLVVCAIMLVAWVRDRNPGPFAVGEDPTFAPAGAVAFAHARQLGGRVANCFDVGGYLLWHMPGEVAVLVDGRNELVYPPAFVLRAVTAEHDAATFASMRAEDGATWAFAVNFPDKPGYGFLARHPDWSLVYWSETAAIYTRRADHPELEGMRYRYVDPLDPPGSVAAAVRGAAGNPAALDAIGREIARMLEASPDSARAVFCLAIFHQLQGPSHEAARDAALDRLLGPARGDGRYEGIARNLRTSPPTASPAGKPEADHTDAPRAPGTAALYSPP